MSTKYTTEVKNNKLLFKIMEGQFKDIVYEYKSLTEKDGLQYKITRGSSNINDKNKFLFEHEIRGILNHKLKSV